MCGLPSPSCGQMCIHHATKHRFSHCEAVALPSTWWGWTIDSAWTSSGDSSGDISVTVTSLKLRYTLMMGTWHVNCIHLVFSHVMNEYPITWWWHTCQEGPHWSLFGISELCKFAIMFVWIQAVFSPFYTFQEKRKKKQKQKWWK